VKQSTGITERKKETIAKDLNVENFDDVPQKCAWLDVLKILKSLPMRPAWMKLFYSELGGNK